MATITEALAEVKTINKRLIKKRELVRRYIHRDPKLVDPHADHGGSVAVIEAEMQSIHDLEERIIAIRLAILRKNLETDLTLNGATRSIFGWLTWRREISDHQQQLLQRLSNDIAAARQAAATKLVVVNGNQVPSEIVVNTNETELGAKVESLEELLGNLDGQLSLLNATTQLDV